MKKNTSKFAKRLAQYGALSAMVAGVSDVNGQVIYTDENPDFVGGFGDQYFLDLDNDGVIDFNLTNQFSGVQINAAAANNGVLGSGSNYFAFPYALNAGDTISSGAAGTFFNNGFSQGINILCYYYYSSSYNIALTLGNWCDTTDRYVGLQFDINGNTHYGWARMDIDLVASTWVVKDYAYEASPGVAIPAGGMGGNGMPPEITCPPNVDINTDMGVCGAVVTYPDPTATDPDGDIDTIEQISPDPTVLSSGDEFPVGTTMVIFRATDMEGNIDECSFDIVVTDVEAPVLTCPNEMSVPPEEVNGVYIVPDYFATGDVTVVDNCTNPVINTTQDPEPGLALLDGPYTVMITAADENGNTTSCEFQLTVDSTLSIEDQQLNNKVVLYPNPTQYEINLINRSDILLKKASIFDLNGRLINEVILNGLDTETSINISDLASGLYLIQIESKDASTIKRFVKE